MKYHNEKAITDAVSIIRKTKTNPVEMVTPDNHNIQKKAFMDAALPAAKDGCEEFPVSVNPTFVYNTDLLHEASNNTQCIKDAKKAIEDNLEPEDEGDRAIHRIILRRIDESIVTTEMAKSILDKEDSATAMYARQKYGSPSGVDIKCAYYWAESEMPNQIRAGTKGSILDEELIVALKEIQLSSDQLKDVFVTGMGFLGIKPWDVIVSQENCTSVDVRDFGKKGKPSVWIPTDRNPDGLEAVKLGGHEIYCHLRGSDNCQRFFEKLFGKTPLKGFKDLIKTDDEVRSNYEGRPKQCDVLVKGLQAAPDPYAIIVIELAQKGMSFGDIAKIIFDLRLKALGEKNEENIKKALTTAWTKTYRGTRGSTDPWKNRGNYAFPKDAAYFLGYRNAERQGLDSVYSDYASMLPDEVDALSDCYPELIADVPSEYTLKSFIQKMSMHVWATYHSYS